MGVWQRHLLETATSKDDSSLVLWMQTQHYHIDIRIPAVCANMRAVTALAEYSDEELLILASQQGFAGITVVTPGNIMRSDVCQWLREIDFQPATDARDIGKMVFIDTNTVIETGVDDAYLEVWRCLPHSREHCAFNFVSGQNLNGMPATSYYMRAGKYIAYARPRQITLPTATLPTATLPTATLPTATLPTATLPAVTLPKSPTLLNLVQANKPSRDLLLSWLDMEISFGEILDGNYWQIKYSTLPFKQGLVLPLIS
jgi:hypothetical protein